jgi:hypothetical protein
MSNQIFKTLVPRNILFELLEKICLKTDKYYLFDNNAYKKMLFNNYHVDFCLKLKPYYHLGKQFYLERKITYNAFTTIIRQLCKYSTIMYTSQIKYNESKYNIDYFVFF